MDAEATPVEVETTIATPIDPTPPTTSPRRRPNVGGLDPDRPLWVIVDLHDRVIYVPRSWSLIEAVGELEGLLAPYPQNSEWRQRLVVRGCVDARGFCEPRVGHGTTHRGISGLDLVEPTPELVRGCVFRARRLALGVTCRELAKASGLAQGSIVNAEHGNTLLPSNLEKLERALRALEEEAQEPRPQ
ncbi:MAG: helix-turn-helix transcriptional regulator [Polyangiaceae bacterium]|nr:helix-turn-helix transcriptional regulator [Polyangiaceae bacterium]